MLALSVIGSPNPASLVHALAATAEGVLQARGYDLARHDLYAEGFQPVQPTGESQNTRSDDALVEMHCAQLKAADLILVSHPNWWGQPPAIVKGWIDRVFRLDTAYGYPPGVSPDGIPWGLLRARAALVVNSSNTPPAREAAVFGDPLEGLWKRCIFSLCGVSRVERRMYGPVAGSDASHRQAWIADLVQLAERLAVSG
jgi:NAD(P)H dehydrogenase (quinone)